MSPATALLDLDLDRPAAAAVQGQALLLLHPVDGWQTKAACRQVDVSDGKDPFFSVDGESHPKTQARQQRAKRLCARCPVRLPCLQYALETLQPHGVWGGMTANERRDLLAAGGVRLPKYHRREAVGGGW